MRNKAIGSPHENHLIKLVATDRTKYKIGAKTNSHLSKYHCVTCNKPINFASKDEWSYWNQQMYEVLTYKDFVDDFINSGKYKPKPVQMKSVVPDDAFVVILECPYSKKDIAKNLGATWNPDIKKWQITSYNKNWERLLPWIHPDDETRLRDAHSKRPVHKPTSIDHVNDGQSHIEGVSKLRQLLQKQVKY